MQVTNVYHERYGIVFRKIQADSGISYIAVSPSDVPEDLDSARDLLVRHGTVDGGRCGYYPLSLLVATPVKRYIVANKAGKKPPSESWVRRTLTALEANGIRVLH
ncbi:hypothetical protein D9M68_18310 [compost metagenome]